MDRAYRRRVAPHDERAADPVVEPNRLALQRAQGNASLSRLLATRRSLQRDEKPGAKTAEPALPWTTFRDWAVTAIKDYETGAISGLDDFEKGFPEKEAGTDWGVFAASVLGSVVWALACFETGGIAFIVSLGGIAIDKAVTGAAMAEAKKGGFDKAKFHHSVRTAISAKDGIVQQLLGRVVDGSHALEAEAATGKWDHDRAHKETLRRIFKGDGFSKIEAGQPAVDKWMVAKTVESQLLLQAASGMPYYKGAFESPQTGEHRTGVTEGYDEGVWMDVQCEVTDAFEADGSTTKPVNQWDIHMKKATIWDRTEQLPQMADRLTDIFGKDFAKPMPIFDWPLRKSVSVNLLGAKDGRKPGADIDLDERSGLRRQMLHGMNEASGRTFFTLSDPEERRHYPRVMSDQMAREVTQLALTRQAIRIHEVSNTPNLKYSHP